MNLYLHALIYCVGIYLCERCQNNAI